MFKLKNPFTGKRNTSVGVSSLTMLNEEKSLITGEPYSSDIAMIHRDFYLSSDKALAEAKAILHSLEDKYSQEKLTMLINAGFSQTPELTKMQLLQSTKRQQENISSVINDYAQKYPQFKFILESDVKVLCKRYNLVFGPTSIYTGFVPEKNLKVITEASSILTKIRSEVKSVMVRIDKVSHYSGQIHETFKKQLTDLCKKHHNRFALDKAQLSYHDESTLGYICRKHNVTNQNVSSCSVSRIEEGLLIAAPMRDFNMQGKCIVDNEIMEGDYSVRFEKVPAPDPIVLQRVDHGFLIITAWGPEASDPLVVNEKFN